MQGLLRQSRAFLLLLIRCEVAGAGLAAVPDVISRTEMTGSTADLALKSLKGPLPLLRIRRLQGPVVSRSLEGVLVAAQSAEKIANASFRLQLQAR